MSIGPTGDDANDSASPVLHRFNGLCNEITRLVTPPKPVPGVSYRYMGELPELRNTVWKCAEGKTASGQYILTRLTNPDLHYYIKSDIFFDYFQETTQ